MFLHQIKKIIYPYFISFLEDISQVRYEIGFPINSLEEILSGDELRIRWLRHNYKDRWFADPFILDVTDDSIILLVEEFLYKTQKGRIARLTINRKTFRLEKNDLLLELNSHLSFPAIFREDGQLFIYPENCNDNHLILYQFDDKKFQCLPIQTLIDAPLTDGIICDFLCGRLLLSTYLPDANGKILTIYKRSSDNGLYVYNQEIQFDENIARNAGACFSLNGRLFRPAQECNQVYGHCVVLQEIKEDGKSLNFVEMCRLYSTHKYMKDGLHTFNTFKGVHVIDVNGCRRPFIKGIINKLLFLL